ncbi:MAG: SUMF1/EgtB/PvdO family nonheme iron enzyme [Planctomycetota bacterium]
MPGPRLFICYRREDAGGFAVELAAALRAELGDDGLVFLDEQSTAAGEKWPDRLRKELEIADGLVVVIGPAWLKLQDPESGRRRLDMDHDWVREEIARGLARTYSESFAVVPVLVGGTSMPEPRHLPDSIQALPSRQAIEAQADTIAATAAAIVELVREVAPAPLPALSSPDPFAAYRVWVLERHRSFDLQAMGSGRIHLPLQQVYVPLRLAEDRRIMEADDVARAIATGRPPDEGLTVERVFTACPPERPHALVFGDPGAGKTTALRKLLLDGLQDPGCLPGLVADVLPVFLPLRRFDRASLERGLEDNLSAVLAHESAQKLPADLGRALWQHGRLLLLLDGLDEAGDEGFRRDLCQYLELQLARVPHSRAVVSCRSTYRAQVQLGPKCTGLEVRPLGREQCRDLVLKWFAAAAQQTQLTMPEANERAQRLLQALDDGDYAAQRLQVLVGTPLLLTLLCVVVLNEGEMPKHRVTFYARCLEVLLRNWNVAKDRRQPLLDVETALDVLRPLARKLHGDRRRDNLRPNQFALLARPILRVRGEAVGPRKVLEWLHKEAGVLLECDPDEYGFLHLGLQEYLCAEQIARSGDEAVAALTAQAGDEWWHEVTLLHVGLRDRQTFGPWCRALLQQQGWIERRGLLADALRDARQPDLGPLPERLKAAPVGDEHVVLLELLQHRSEPSVLAAAEALREVDHEGVRTLARSITDRAAERQWTGARDLYVVGAPGDAEAAGELARGLRQGGLGAHVDTLEDLDGALAQCRTIVVLATAAGRPWEDRDVGDALDLLCQEKRAFVVRLGGASGGAPDAWEAQVIEAQNVAAAVRGVRAVLPAGGETARGLEKVRADRPTDPPSLGDAWVEETTGIRFVGVPGGAFMMGAGESKHAHRVTLSPFWLGETPVTNAQFAKFLEATSHEEPSYWRDRRFSDPDQPVVGVGAEDAGAFCAWLASVTDLPVVLPSEAQWEYAARSTDGRRYPWGPEEPDGSRADFGQDWGSGQPKPVGSHPAGRGPFHALDQAGCVWEWCADDWAADAYKKRSGEEVRDPLVRVPGASERVLRGGAWYDGPGYLRSGVRVWGWARDRNADFGFRVALSPASSS